MTMSPRLRKFALAAHIVFSVGWLGAIVPYLALTVAGLTSHDTQMARSAFLSMEVIGWFVIIPFSLAALLSGLVQALGTQWGLFRHWWVLAKFALTIFATAILLLHMRDVSRVARMAKETTLTSADFRPELIHAAGGLLVVLAATMLSVFKPWGMTPYGRRQTLQTDFASSSEQPSYAGAGVSFHGQRISWARIIGYHAVALVLLFALIFHLTNGGLHHH